MQVSSGGQTGEAGLAPTAEAGCELPEGIWCADGDADDNNPIVRGHRTRVVAGSSLQFYSVVTLDAASPCDLVAVYPRVTFAPAAKILDGQLAGWHDDGTTLTAPNGQEVVHGFREYVLAKVAAKLWVGGQPYAAEWGDGRGGSVQVFAATLLLWDATTGVREGTQEEALAMLAHVREGKAA